MEVLDVNWIVGNLQNALDTWNGKLSEIYMLVTQSPADFKGGAIWNIILKKELIINQVIKKENEK